MQSIIDTIKQTYLIERLVGLFLYVLIVSIGFYNIKYGSKRRARNSFVFVAVALSLLAYFYIPFESADLTRIREMTKNWPNYSFSYVIEKEIATSPTPLGSFIFYIFSLTKNNGLMPAFTCLVFYLNCFYILYDLIKRGYSNKHVALGFLFFMSSGAFLEAISDVRCFLSFSMIILAAYRIASRGKVSIFDLIAIAAGCLIHSAAIALILIVVVFYLFFMKHKTGAIFRLAVFAVIAFMAVYFGWQYILSMFTKAESYLSNEKYSYIWEYLIGFVFAIAIIYSLVVFGKSKKRNIFDFSQTNVFKITLILVLVSIVFAWEYNIFHRFITATSLLASCLVVYNLSKNKSYSDNYYKTILVISCLILLIACARGNLCGFKFFELN